ncbi:CoA pyrophosphatase [Methylobrevis pamukkalensis]|uniref:Putative NUDIX hydrolase n=1 Tax=Methylobrevis pamukkalensis TaxID=1439726 RepID=A0A1E3H630_9HYPH|nr:CoA pyrophosphatase [Methylobrevis pamukkalensis]ODN71595.1 putative NUDIX hydrolase [Methylobrevis pamukkalensis]
MHDRPASAMGFDEADLRSRIGRMHPVEGVTAVRRSLWGDHVTEPSLASMIEGLTLRPAAVLIPLVLRESGTTVIFTRRNDHMRAHAGQIAFPGGKIDPEDGGPLVAALREAEEEIGLDRRLVEPLGQLDSYISNSGYEIVPVVGLVQPDPPLQPNPDEVADVFEVPLGFLMAPDNHLFEMREYKGLTRRVYAMPYEERRIWGVTAGIVRLFYEQVFA